MVPKLVASRAIRYGSVVCYVVVTASTLVAAIPFARADAAIGRSPTTVIAILIAMKLLVHVVLVLLFCGIALGIIRFTVSDVSNVSFAQIVDAAAAGHLGLVLWSLASFALVLMLRRQLLVSGVATSAAAATLVESVGRLWPIRWLSWGLCIVVACVRLAQVVSRPSRLIVVRVAIPLLMATGILELIILLMSGKF